MAINEKRIHPTSKESLCNYRKVDKGRAGVLGKPPPQTPGQQGELGGLRQGVDEGTAEFPCKPREATSQNSFSSQAGWELYHAVRQASYGEKARLADRLALSQTEQASGTPQRGSQAEGSGQGACRGPDSPGANLEGHVSSQQESQAGWDMEQEWLQECAAPSDELGPWADLVR